MNLDVTRTVYATLGMPLTAPSWSTFYNGDLWRPRYTSSNAAVNPFGNILDCLRTPGTKYSRSTSKPPFYFQRLCSTTNEREGRFCRIYLQHEAPAQTTSAPTVEQKLPFSGLTKALAVETAVDNIRVNCVAPGIVKLSFASALTDTEWIAKKTMETIPWKGSESQMISVESSVSLQVGRLYYRWKYCCGWRINARRCRDFVVTNQVLELWCNLL